MPKARRSDAIKTAWRRSQEPDETRDAATNTVRHDQSRTQEANMRNLRCTIDLRMGLNTVEIELRRDDRGGMAVRFGARVAVL